MSLFTRDMAFQELVELVTAYLDGSLSRSDRRRFTASLLDALLGGSASSRARASPTSATRSTS